MKVFLRVLGHRLFDRVTREMAAADSAFPRRLCTGKPLRWHLELLEEPLSTCHLENSPEQTAVVLIEASAPYIFDELWAIGSREYLALHDSTQHYFRPSPVILVFDTEFPTGDWVEMPMVVTDWVSGKHVMHDLARRVIASLRRLKHLRSELGGGLLVLNPTTRTISYEKNSVQLTPSEVPLAELFLAHLGSVVPIEEILLMFRLAGRSTSGSNLRVTIFQLRYKLELLTGHHFVLACAYGEGYVLRPTRNSDSNRPVVRPEARQHVALQGSG